MRKFLALVLCLMTFAAFATEVDLAEARRFAKDWRGKNVSASRTHRSEKGESRFHVIDFEGGGWAAVGTDDEESPVIAFSDNGEDLVEDERNAVWFLVKRDAERRAKERGLKGSRGSRGRHKGWDGKKVRSSFAEAMEDKEARGVKTATVKTGASTTALADVRVAPLIQSTWDQKKAGGSNTYNYYTPGNYYCGCVATMMAQMMRYHEWPKTSVTPQTFPCFVGTTIPEDTRTIYSNTLYKNCTMKGGSSEWSKMTLNPNGSTPDENRQAIGKLCYDVGVSVCMMWSANGSGAYITNAREALVGTWGYSNAQVVVFQSPSHNYDFDELKTIVISNCEAGLPVGYGISSAKEGHAVVIDGYGYSESGEFYMHINPGWGGSANAWYNPPNLTMGGYAFDSSDELLFNVFTEGSGQLVTGKVVDQHGAPVAGAEVKAYQVTSTATKLLTTVTSAADGRYSFKTGVTGREVSLYATATLGRSQAEKTAELPAAQTMKGDRTAQYAFIGSYSPNGYSLGNKIDFDFVLPITPPKVIFR